MSWSVNFVWLANLLIIELRSLPGIGRFFLWDGKIKQISLKIKGMGSSSDLRPTSWLHWKSARHSELKNFYTIIYHMIYSSGFILVPKLRPIHIWTKKIIRAICGRTWVQPIFSTWRCWIKVSGSGYEWKLHCKGFDEELEEGQVKLVSSPIQPDIGEKPILSFEIENFCPLISKFERRSRISNDLWGFNKWLTVEFSDSGAAVQDRLLQFKAICHQSGLQWWDSVQVSGRCMVHIYNATFFLVVARTEFMVVWVALIFQSNYHDTVTSDYKWQELLCSLL